MSTYTDEQIYRMIEVGAAYRRAWRTLPRAHQLALVEVLRDRGWTREAEIVEAGELIAPAPILPACLEETQT